MADITHNDPLVTESKLTEFYNDIKPFLGCPAYVTQEGDEMYFSTEEKVVGRWIDGRPLYQKTFTKNNISVSSNTPTYTVMGSGAENCELIYSFGDREKAEPVPYSWYSLQIMGSLDTSAGNFMAEIYRAGSAFTLSSLTITYIYVKTTDSAVTTVEQKPTHYSIDEQVIGTWIDGKPVYQKTISTTVPTSSDYNLNIGAINIAQLVDLKAITGDTPTGNIVQQRPIPFLYYGTASTGAWEAGMLLNKDNGDDIIVIQMGADFKTRHQGKPLYITLQYTKTTD